MNETPATSQWAAARGEKWSAHLSGMEATLLPLDEPLIRALQLDRPVRIAEVGCGGGGTAMNISRRAPQGSVVHGFDVSPTLIEVARERALGAGSAAIDFQIADMATAMPPRPYDRLASRFGVMFFDEPPRAFANLARWLPPGGHFAFAVWGPVSENPWMTTVRDAVAGVVEIPQTAPDAPGPFRYGDVDKLLALLGDAGFANLAARDWQGALPIGGGLRPVEAAHFAIAAFSSFGELLQVAGDDAFEQAHQSLAGAFTQHQQDGTVRMNALVRFVTGTRR